MSPSTEPLLAQDRPSSEHSDDRAAEEEDALLRAHSESRDKSHKTHGFWREVALFLWAVIATAGVIILAVLYQHQKQTDPKTGDAKQVGKRNLIFMVSDGMGPASLSMTRSFRQYTENLPIDDTLVLDRYFLGTSRTRSSDSLVTDSAAGATAFSCGFKTYNEAVAVLEDLSPCGTILEAAKKAGYITGLVVTGEITDATPACFAAHATSRFKNDAIAVQEIGEHPLGRVVDLIFGGGRCRFLPNTTREGCRKDDRDILKLAQDTYGWNYISDRAGFDGLQNGAAVKLPILGLFARLDIPYELDRKHVSDIYPSLDEMARTALAALDAATKHSDKGFFLMIEGSRIDHAGHGNDPAAQVHEVLAYDKAFQSVIEYLDMSETDGVLVSTSDHETGGLALARQLQPTYPDYLWYPEPLARASHSAEYLAVELYKHVISDARISQTVAEFKQYINETLVQKGLGITDATDTEIQQLADNAFHSSYFFADMTSRRAQLGWSTEGHSAVDVNIYGSKGSHVLRGNHENTEIGKFLSDYLGLDLEPITRELNEKAKESVGDVEALEEVDFRKTSHHYPGDLRMHMF